MASGPLVFLFPWTLTFGLQAFQSFGFEWARNGSCAVNGISTYLLFAIVIFSAYPQNNRKRAQLHPCGSSSRLSMQHFWSFQKVFLVIVSNIPVRKLDTLIEQYFRDKAENYFRLHPIRNKNYSWRSSLVPYQGGRND